jgi:hypothetical protein
MPRGLLRGLWGCKYGVLFENSIVCLVVFVCCFFEAILCGGTPRLPVLLGVVSVFLMPVFGVFLLGQIFLIRIPPVLVMGCFCLESLILAQDERWRRA